jgi:hypothetical protein
MADDIPPQRTVFNRTSDFLREWIDEFHQGRFAIVVGTQLGYVSGAILWQLQYVAVILHRERAQRPDNDPR